VSARLTRCFAFFALSLVLGTDASTLVHGQARATASGPGSFLALGGGASAFQSDYGRQRLGGAFAFVDVQPEWRAGFELEYRRLSINNTEQLGQTNYLAGVRLTARPAGWSPYVKLLAGDAHIDLPFGYAKGDYLAIVPGGGLEYSIGNRVTLRVLDIECQYWPTFSFGSLRPVGLSTGLSFRLNQVSLIPKGSRARH
jgi:hypothetical protein